MAFVAGTYIPKMDGIADYTKNLLNQLETTEVEWQLFTGLEAASMADRRIRPITRGWGWKEVWRLAKAINEYKPQIIHIQHGAGSYRFNRAIFCLPIMMRLLRWRGKIVTTVHEYGNWEWRPTGWRMGLKRLLTWWGNKSGCWETEDWFLLAMSEVVVTTNNAGESMIKKRLPKMKGKILRVPLASNIKTGHYRRDKTRKWLIKKYNWNTKDSIGCFFGFIHPVKGIETMLRALALVNSQEIKRTNILIIGGTDCLSMDKKDSRDYFKKLLILAGKLGVESNIYFTGYQSEKMVSRMLAGCDWGILPFNHGVTMKSGSLLTMIRHDLPTIVTSEEETDGEMDRISSLLKIKPKDVRQMAEAMLTFAVKKRRRRPNPTIIGLNWQQIGKIHQKLYWRLGNNGTKTVNQINNRLRTEI